MKTLFKRFADDESGATAIEYALMAGLIAIGIIAGARTLGTTLSAKFGAIATTVGATSTTP